MSGEGPEPVQVGPRLVVFSDDWGRHPSSCQHLIRHLLDRHPTLWVNTIGTRAPKLCREDLGKAGIKLRQWFAGSRATPKLPPNLSVLSPPMYPGFRRPWQRRLNAILISRTVNRSLGPANPDQLRIGLTTIAITADLVGRLDVDRWVYYCVDDFSVWPGTDGEVLDQLERQLAGDVDHVVCVSPTLQERLAGMGAESDLLTHGIDLEHWHHDPAPGASLPPWWSELHPPILLFWGAVDTRLDMVICEALATCGGSFVLVGPQQSPDARLSSLPGVVLPGPVPFDSLPAIAAAADILVMPYADMPVTRAMQPLKFKEYLATGKPVVVRDLPATQPWSNAADIAATPEQFVDCVRRRLAEGISPAQALARKRLSRETWQEKARQLEAILMRKGSVGSQKT